MGTLRYASGDSFEIDDRTLAHVHRLLTIKLRREESFMLNWTLPSEHGSGRVSVWISPQVPVIVRFDGSRSASINQAWLGHLLEESFTANGVEVTSEADFERFATPNRP